MNFLDFRCITDSI